MALVGNLSACCGVMRSRLVTNSYYALQIYFVNLVGTGYFHARMAEDEEEVIWSPQDRAVPDSSCCYCFPPSHLVGHLAIKYP